MDPLPNQQQFLQSSMLHAQKDDLSGQVANARGKQIAHFEGNISNSDNLPDSHRTRDQVHVLINDHIESFLFPNENANELISTSSVRIATPEGFTCEEIRSVRLFEEKLLSCHFSSDGEYLAAASQGKKVFIWKMKNFELIHDVERHSDVITDIRFRPESYVYATSSFDRTIELWDLKKPRKTLGQLKGHAERVNSLDFNPIDKHLLSSCDNSDQILLWDLNKGEPIDRLKGGRRQVRFNPTLRRHLAAASGNNINVFDLDNRAASYCLKGHEEEVRSICWDVSGKYLGSVSANSARIWSFSTDWSCVHAIQKKGSKFESCIFHPGYYLAMAMGSCQTIQWWNPVHKPEEIMQLHAHDGFIAALTDCTRNDMMASAGYDGIVKVWK